MSFDFKSSTGKSININIWQWPPILELLRRSQIIDAETLDRMRYNATGVKISKQQALSIAEFLDKFVRALKPDTVRILLDLSESDLPDDRVLHHDDAHNNYSTPVNKLAEFMDFCKGSDGFAMY